MRMQTSREAVIRISPDATVLPANTLRFYIHFPRPGEAHFDRDRLWLMDEEGEVVPDPFLVLSQELWSVDGRRLTVLMEPGRIKRGLGMDPSHEPALVTGRTYSLVITALGQTARHTFPCQRCGCGRARRDALASRLTKGREPRSRCRALRQGHGCRPLRGRDQSHDPFQGRSRRRASRSPRMEPRRGFSQVTRGTPVSTASSSQNGSKTCAATGWAKP